MDIVLVLGLFMPTQIVKHGQTIKGELDCLEPPLALTNIVRTRAANTGPFFNCYEDQSGRSN